MKVGEVIRYSAELRKKDCKKEAERPCERLELLMNKKIRELSLGNQKKVSIVCALQHEPRLCILDEPTSGLAALFYFLNIIVNLTASAKFLKYITPFCYTDGADIITNGRIETGYLAVGIVITIADTAAAFVKYRRKDIM